MTEHESIAAPSPAAPTSDGSQASRLKPRRRRGWLVRLIGDVFFITKRDRQWWTLPLILLLLILGALLAFAAVLGPLAPFVYPFL